MQISNPITWALYKEVIQSWKKWIREYHIKTLNMGSPYSHNVAKSLQQQIVVQERRDSTITMFHKFSNHVPKPKSTK